MEPQLGKVHLNLLNPEEETVALKAGSTIVMLEPVETPKIAVIVSITSTKDDKRECYGQLVVNSGEELTVGVKEQHFVCFRI